MFDAIESAGKQAVVACANGKVFPMSESDIEQKIGRENLDRMERMGIPFHQNDPRNAEAYTYIGVSSRGTPVWILTAVAECDLKITIGHAQANHWGAGGGGKLILPGVASDETIEQHAPGSRRCTTSSRSRSQAVLVAGCGPDAAPPSSVAAPRRSR